MSKIKPIETLASMLEGYRGSLVVVQCHGCFDLLHIGHIRHFQEARRMGDVLVVTVTPDKYVNKGAGRPIFSQDLRAETIAALECVDYVAVNKWSTAVEAISIIKPSIFAKGMEYRGNMTPALAREAWAVQNAGGRLEYTDGSVEFHSTEILESLRA